MYPEPVVQCNFLFVLNVLKAVVPGLDSDRQESTQPGRLAFDYMCKSGINSHNQSKNNKGWQN